MYLRISIRRCVRPTARRAVRPSVGMSRFCKKCMKLRVLCTERIEKAYKVMSYIKTAKKTLKKGPISPLMSESTPADLMYEM